MQGHSLRPPVFRRDQMPQWHRRPTYDAVGCTFAIRSQPFATYRSRLATRGPPLRPLGRVCAPVGTEYRELVVAAGLVPARAHGEAPNGQSHCAR